MDEPAKKAWVAVGLADGTFQQSYFCCASLPPSVKLDLRGSDGAWGKERSTGLTRTVERVTRQGAGRIVSTPRGAEERAAQWWPRPSSIDQPIHRRHAPGRIGHHISTLRIPPRRRLWVRYLSQVPVRPYRWLGGQERPWAPPSIPQALLRLGHPHLPHARTRTRTLHVQSFTAGRHPGQSPAWFRFLGAEG